jgi:hypothetical protein
MTPRPPATVRQAAFLAQLGGFAADPDKPVLHVEDITETHRGRLHLSMVDGEAIVVLVRLDTSRLPERRDGGLRVDPHHEDVLLLVWDVFPAVPPSAHVHHRRFLTTPHVLQGFRLCVYLDPAQEWHPRHTAVDFMEQLWRWFCDAVTGQFDARTALYHPVGGVIHRTLGTPLIVVRDEPVYDGAISRMRLKPRGENRLDLRPIDEEGFDVLVVALAGALYYGAGRTLGSLCAALAQIGQPDPDGFGIYCKPARRTSIPSPAALVTALAVSALGTPRGTPVYFLLAVPTEPRLDSKRHLLCGRLAGPAADTLRDRAAADGTLGTTVPDIDQQAIEWCRVSEERPDMTTRRDSRTPVQSLRGATVVVLGCGGLGSWIAEFVARAGARKIILFDANPVTGGLLVRQDYTEQDVGTPKALALAHRLDSLRDDLHVGVMPGDFVLGAPIPNCDLLIDATVNRSVGAALAAAWTHTRRTPLVAYVATDRATSTLGLLTLTRPGTGPDPETADAAAGETVLATPELEKFACFWQPPTPEEELNPAPGCSVPTFHGSAADLAAIAGALTRLIAGNLAAPDMAGTHLVAMAHAGHREGHTWLPFSAAPSTPATPPADTHGVIVQQPSANR